MSATSHWFPIYTIYTTANVYAYIYIFITTTHNTFHENDFPGDISWKWLTRDISFQSVYPSHTYFWCVKCRVHCSKFKGNCTIGVIHRGTASYLSCYQADCVDIYSYPNNSASKKGGCHYFAANNCNTSHRNCKLSSNFWKVK